MSHINKTSIYISETDILYWWVRYIDMRLMYLDMWLKYLVKKQKRKSLKKKSRWRNWQTSCGCMGKHVWQIWEEKLQKVKKKLRYLYMCVKCLDKWVTILDRWTRYLDKWIGYLQSKRQTSHKLYGKTCVIKERRKISKNKT
jgi:hypothetical protein